MNFILAGKNTTPQVNTTNEEKEEKETNMEVKDDSSNGWCSNFEKELDIEEDGLLATHSGNGKNFGKRF
jgi:hypothetical protein